MWRMMQLLALLGYVVVSSSTFYLNIHSILTWFSEGLLIFKSPIILCYSQWHNKTAVLSLL